MGAGNEQHSRVCDRDCEYGNHLRIGNRRQGVKTLPLPIQSFLTVL